MLFKISGSGEPSRLFMAGVHGNESVFTEPILEVFSRDIEIKKGRLILCCLSGGEPYISTLDKAYYGSKSGRKLLDMIRKYRPRIYLELHSYGIENHRDLTDPDRKSQIGVPPFTELEENVLLGSVSPLIRTTEFRMEDLCFTLEVPAIHSEKASSVVLDVLRIIALSADRNEVISRLREKYPEQMSEAGKNYFEFFRDSRIQKY